MRLLVYVARFRPVALVGFPLMDDPATRTYTCGGCGATVLEAAVLRVVQGFKDVGGDRVNTRAYVMPDVMCECGFVLTPPDPAPWEAE